MASRSEIFVSTSWLSDHLGDGGVAVVDGSWYLPTARRDPKAEYEAAHIPGAVFFDIDGIADETSGLPHMLPSPEAFAAAVGALGIADDQTIVVYDGLGLFSAPRVRWSFRAMGAADVRILAGGFPLWLAEGRPIERGLRPPAPRLFRPRFEPAAVAAFDDVRAAAAAGRQVVDARPADRFRGEAPEPRPGLKSGHVPGSRSLPSSDVVEDGQLKSPEALAALFAEAGIDPSRETITSCGSGVTAAVIALALETTGADKVAVYDGSWAEWGGRPDAPVETGPAR